MAYTLAVQTIPDTIGAVELTSIARGYRVADRMVKKAPITVLDARAMCPGKFLIVVAGAVGPVEEAMSEARREAGESLFGDLLIANLSRGIIAAINREVTAAAGETVGILESFSGVAVIDAADQAVKTADVVVESIDLLDGIGGKAFLVVSGGLTDVEAALEAAERRIPPGMRVAAEILPQFSPEIAGFLPGRERG